MQNPRKRPGYVYILLNPAIDGWYKVGRTQKPPYKRVKTLSGTSSPLDFEIVYVRYFLDCVSAEYNIHTQLEKTLGKKNKRKEFFYGDVHLITSIVSSYQDISLKEAINLKVFKNLPDTEDFYFVHEENSEELELQNKINTLFDKAKIKSISPSKTLSDIGAKELESLSNMGHGLSTWYLGNYLLKNPKLSENEISWLFDVSEMQGVPGGRLKGSWIRSKKSEDWKRKWIIYLDLIWNDFRNTPYQEWSEELHEILELEIFQWHQKKKPIFYHKIWEFICKELQAKSDKTLHEVKCLWILENIAFKRSKIM